MKKLLSGFLAVAMLFSCLAMPAFAADVDPLLTQLATYYSSNIAKSGSEMAAQEDGITEAEAQAHVDARMSTWGDLIFAALQSHSLNTEGKTVAELKEAYTVTYAFTEGGFVAPVNGEEGTATAGSIAFTAKITDGTHAYNLSFSIVLQAYETKTIVVSDAASLRTAMENATEGTTVELASDILISAYDYAEGYFVYTFYGTLDGKDHTISIDNEEGAFFPVLYYAMGGASVKDVNVEILSITSSFVYVVSSYGDNAFTMDDVDILDVPEQIVEIGGNSTPYVCHVFTDMVMKNCDNYEQFNGSTYNALFVGGYYGYGCDVSFTNCNNYGDYSGEWVALFAGNPSKPDGTTYNSITITDCYNYALVTGTKGANVFTVYNNSTFYNDLNTTYSIESINKDGGEIKQMDAYAISGTIASDGVITISDDEATPSAASYGMRLWQYSSSDSGTWVVGVKPEQDTVDALNAAGVTYGTFIDDVTFANTYGDVETYLPSWDPEGDDALNSLSYTVATVDGTLYYIFEDLVTETATYTINRSPRVDVYALNENGSQLSSVTVSAPTLADVSFVATVGEVAYFSLADAIADATATAAAVTAIASTAEDIALPADMTLTLEAGASVQSITMTLGSTLVNNSGAAVEVTFNNDTVQVAAGETYIATVVVSEVEEAVSTTVEAALDLSTDDVTTSGNAATNKETVNDAASEVTALDKEVLATSDAVVAQVNALDELFIAANSITVTASGIVEKDVAEETQIDTDAVEVSGLALAVYGDDAAQETDDLKLVLTQMAVSEEEAAAGVVLVDASIYKVASDNSETEIDNDDLLSPITFKIPLNANFPTATATVVHTSDEGVTTTTTKTVQDFGTESPYILMTVTHFSAIEVTPIVSSPAQTFTITCTAGTGGYFTCGSTATARIGEMAGFTIVCDDGYVIADVKVDGVSVGAVSYYVMTNILSDRTIEATFTLAGSAESTAPTTGDDGSDSAEDATPDANSSTGTGDDVADAADVEDSTDVNADADSSLVESLATTSAINTVWMLGGMAAVLVLAGGAFFLFKRRELED